MERLAEIPAGAAVVEIRPEQTEEVVAAVSGAGAGGRDVGEQREVLGLQMDGLATAPAVRLQLGSTQREESNHCMHPRRTVGSPGSHRHTPYGTRWERHGRQRVPEAAAHGEPATPGDEV